MMTQTEQRIAIAEWMGWKKCDTSGTECWICPDTGVHTTSGNLTIEFPNYPLDLNAMHEAEKKLKESLTQWEYYLDALAEITKSDCCHATASQRSEALCRIIWPERFEQ